MDTFSAENIERIRLLAQEIRKKHKVMEWGVPTSHLIEQEGLEYQEYDLSTRKGLLERFCGIAKKIKAAIFVREKVILIDNGLHYAKKPFGQAHELGHNSIPEHQEILYVCDEQDLNPNTRAEMEFEANIFAAELLIPGPLLKAIHAKYPLSMNTVMQLSGLSGASIHSSAIKYCQSSKEACCLLVLKVAEASDGSRGLVPKSQIASSTWWARHGKIPFKKFFPEDHVISEVVFSGLRDDIVESKLNIFGKDYNLHTFYNSYIVLALIF